MFHWHWRVSRRRRSWSRSRETLAAISSCFRDESPTTEGENSEGSRLLSLSPHPPSLPPTLPPKPLCMRVCVSSRAEPSGAITHTHTDRHRHTHTPLCQLIGRSGHFRGARSLAFVRNVLVWCVRATLPLARRFTGRLSGPQVSTEKKSGRGKKKKENGFQWISNRDGRRW